LEAASPVFKAINKPDRLIIVTSTLLLLTMSDNEFQNKSFELN